MTTYTAPLRDYRFVLHETLKVHELDQVDGYGELTEDLTGAVLEEAGKISSQVLHPLNAVGDREGCRLENGVVRTPTGFKEAFDQFREGGWPSLDCDPAYGGQGMPAVISACVAEMTSSANMALMMYPGLTHGVYSALHSYGTEEQKQTYLPKLVSGEWTGTMNLTEPHCGTDLGLIRTKAVPQADGSYKISGQKIFISAGDHEMASNIIHLVLAKLPDAPEGVKGISLFVVPKYILNADGEPGPRNGVSCGKLEEKMGIHGNATCVLNYDEATGYLVGEPHKGLRAMFVMMNEARIGVGVQGLSQAAIAYENAAAYAKDRLQGRAVTGVAAPDKPADPIIVHPDVRRSLMDQRSFVEGARAFALWCAKIGDESHRHADPEKRAAADAQMGLLTPILKAFVTDHGFENASRGMQMLGGHGYIEEWGMSQFVRDARIAMIYEGANGIQALDLVGRKLPEKGGAALLAFFGELQAFIDENKGNAAIAADFIEPLEAASKDLQAAATYYMTAGMKDPNDVIASSTDFLHLFGHVCLGLMWARMAKTATDALASGASDKAFYENKLITGRYYMKRRLPETALRLTRIQAGGEPVMALATEAY